ncbi:372_t:CDS:2 [Racocetra persica]|uniref:372_t:CDS:1 n=1 Tax=Racocetra persica TaxID=160502 RepID=A0ACA9LNX2_9GLOM|nr:372_t:CDS:2 [Racocetra persica]
MRALIAEQPDIFPLRKTLQGFIDKRLENIKKKAHFLYRKNQKELLNLETRCFIVENYQEIAQIIRNSSSEEQSKKELLASGAAEQEKYRELTNLLRQIDNYKDEKSYHHKEREINELKEKVSNLNYEELSVTPAEPEIFPNPEQEVIDRILDTPASFRQFTLERREKLQKEIADRHQEIAELQSLITDQESRKQKLIAELQELQKVYAHDLRRTQFSDEKHIIEERELIPHEERVAILSQNENKKDKSINIYLNVYDLEAIEATNMPSQGKELKTRGDNLNFVKLCRRDDL